MGGMLETSSIRHGALGNVWTVKRMEGASHSPDFQVLCIEIISATPYKMSDLSLQMCMYHATACQVLKLSMQEFLAAIAPGYVG